jgi:hypothetical protein
MQMAVARVLLNVLGIGCLAGCAVQEPAAAPVESAARSDAESADQRELHALELRRQRLQAQLLSELRKLHESRQASAGGAPEAAEAAAPADEGKLLVFGGVSHEVFLGCLCEEQDRDSVFNMTGEFGSDLSTTSIRNKFAPYGSDHDDTSTCNAGASRPPLVVTSDGKSLGLLTVNPSLKKRITAPSVGDWLARMCAQ